MSVEEDHAQWWLTTLRAVVSYPVFDGKVTDPTPAPPYVVAYLTVSYPRDTAGNAITGAQTVVRTSGIFHCVGETEAAARGVGSDVRAAYLGVRPVISGRNCGLVKQDEEPAPPVRDESLGYPDFDFILSYSTTTTG